AAHTHTHRLCPLIPCISVRGWEGTESSHRHRGDRQRSSVPYRARGQAPGAHRYGGTRSRVKAQSPIQRDIYDRGGTARCSQQAPRESPAGRSAHRPSPRRHPDHGGEGGGQQAALPDPAPGGECEKRGKMPRRKQEQPQRLPT
ncbi:hypothetical protein NDU88_004232, partial [Pleurodeles waltl]